MAACFLQVDLLLFLNVVYFILYVRAAARAVIFMLKLLMKVLIIACVYCTVVLLPLPDTSAVSAVDYY